MAHRTAGCGGATGPLAACGARPSEDKTPDTNLFRNVGRGIVGVLTVVDGTDAELDIAAVVDLADNVVLPASVVPTVDGPALSLDVPDSGVASETIVLVDVSADVATGCDDSLDLSRSDVSDPRADDGEVS
jgi:hypothetical protein